MLGNSHGCEMISRKFAFSEVSIKKSEDGQIIQGKCPHCHFQFRKLDANSEFLVVTARCPATCTNCNREFEFGEPYPLPWLNYVPIQARLRRTGMTRDGASSFNESLLQMFSHAIAVEFYGESKLQADAFHLCRFDARGNNEGISADFFEAIFHHEAEGHIFRQLMFSDHPLGAEARFVELNPDVSVPWVTGLIRLHHEMGFPNGIPFQQLWDEFSEIV